MVRADVSWQLAPAPARTAATTAIPRWRRGDRLSARRRSRLPSRFEPAAQLRKRDHDVMAVSRPLAQALIPGGHVRNVRTFDIELEIAIKRRAGGNIRQREPRAGQERPRRQNLVQQPKMAGAARETLADRGPVALRFRRAIVTPENTHQI